MADNEFKPGFIKVLKILQPYLSEIVIGGGWVPLIYYHYLLADKSLNPLFTKDIDLIVPDSVPVIDGKSIDQLLNEAGLKADFRSRHVPPVICYEGYIEGDEVEVEFLTDQRGKGEPTVQRVQEGLNAQALRYISILQENSMKVEIDDLLRSDGRPLIVKVPIPGAYILHKGLVFTRRSDELKKTKDLYYIFDILANCPQLHDPIVEELLILKNKYPLKWFSEFSRNLKTNFDDAVSDGVHLVADQRPADAFSNLDGDQFRQYILGIFQAFLAKITPAGSSQ